MGKKRRVAALSEAFLLANRARLDAIGPWEVRADADNLDIVWKRPPALQTGWVPVNLRFHTDSESASFDPDERMFALYDLFVSRQTEFVAQLRAVAAEADEEMGRVVRGRVEVYREGGTGEDGGDHHDLNFFFRFADEVEHAPYSSYDEATGRFGALEM